MMAAVATLDMVRDRVRHRWLPPARTRVSEFADTELVVSSGKYQHTRWRTWAFQRGIMDAFHEPGVEIVVVKSSSQVGKTSILLALIAYHVDLDPCPILVVQPTVPMGEQFSRDRLDPMLAANARLRAAFMPKRKKDSSNTVLHKAFMGGSLAIAGANSAASLAARSVRVLGLDEINRYPRELPGEGSTVEIALKRTAAYLGRRRVLIESTPTVVDGPIDDWYLRGDQRHFETPCPACGSFFVFRWACVRWREHDPSMARLHCPGCDHALTDAERIEAGECGRWVAQAPNRSERNIVSFWLWEAMSPLARLDAMVAGFLQAREIQKRGNPSVMHVWQNTTLGESYEPERGDGVEPTALLLRRDVFEAPVPAGACVLTMAVDTQDEWLEALVVGWGPGEECWLVDHQRIDGDTSQPEPWLALDDCLDAAYTHASGASMTAQYVCIDSAGHRTTTVYDYVAKRGVRRVVAIIGRDGPRGLTSAPSPRRWGASQRKIPLYTIGVDAAKALWMSRLKVDTPGPGYVHLPLADWCGDEFVAQLTSERLVTHWHKGVRSETWEKTRARNEALDLAVYNLAALRLTHPDLEALAARMHGGAPKPLAPAAPTKNAGWIPPRREGGWLHGRRDR